MEVERSAFASLMRIERSNKEKMVAEEFISNGMINGQVCIHCGTGWSWITENKTPETSSRLRYKCRACGGRYYTTSLTYFHSMNLSFTQFSVMLKYFLMGFSSTTTHQLLRNHFEQDGMISLVSIRRHFHELKNLVRHYINESVRTIRLPGPVEIDETLLYRQKISRAPARTYVIRLWLFGMRCRTTKRFVIYPIYFRTRETLLRLIRRHVPPGATILTDCWSAYINNRVRPRESFLTNYVHLWIDHSVHFVSPILRGIHTNTIERLWRTIKTFFRIHNPRKFLNNHIAMFYFTQVYDLNERTRILFTILRDVRMTLQGGDPTVMQ